MLKHKIQVHKKDSKSKFSFSLKIALCYSIVTVEHNSKHHFTNVHLKRNTIIFPKFPFIFTPFLSPVWVTPFPQKAPHSNPHCTFHCYTQSDVMLVLIA